MSTGCDKFRTQIPRVMISDLDAAEQQALDRHLEECAPCAAEKVLYTQTFDRLRSLEDEPVPRHFLVHPEERRATPWQLFRMLAPAWQGTLAAAALIFMVISGMAASRLQVKAGNGALTISFGGTAPSRSIPAAAPTLDTAALESRILQVVGEKNRKENLEWVRTLREEMARSQKGITGEQRALLETALNRLEARMVGRLDETARTIEDRNSRTISGFYQALKLQRDADLALLDSRMNRLAISGEVKSTQTDAILETLLQVAELNSR